MEGARSTRDDSGRVEGMVMDDVEADRALASVKERLFGVPADPVKIGRFLVVRRLGAGGMGIVYECFDPKLDRKIAVKLLQADRSGPGSPEHERLLREAKALAKLAHPNVIAVFDVGTVREQIFIAMELVEGQTLRQWLRTAPRSVREILAVFKQVGRGLAAAHAAGLMHRDLKPDNVVLGQDGRARVLDFGLARPIGPAEPGTTDAASPDSGAIDLTAKGAVMGTPAYMAPEQHRGEEVDDRTDQFSFCVALFEALHGQRPFVGDSTSGLRHAVTTGSFQAPPVDAKVPRWIRQIVQRGLSIAPEDRYPNMAELLADLDRDPARRVRIGAAVAGGAILVASVIGFSGNGAAVERCESVNEAIDAVWNESHRHAIREQFVGSGYRGAEQTYETVTRALTEYTAAWSAMHRESCVATHVQGAQSTEVMELRSACLASRLRELTMVVQLLERADEDAVGEAMTPINLLSPVEACADVDNLARRSLAEPEDPAVVASVAAVRDRLREAVGLGATGKYAEALALTGQAVEDARQVGYVAVQAEAHFGHGQALLESGAHQEAVDSFKEALKTAQASGHDVTVARAAIKLAFTEGEKLGRFDAGHSWVAVAEGAIAGLGGDDVLQAELFHSKAALLGSAGRYEEAYEAGRSALELAERVLGRRHPQTLTTAGNVGEYLRFLGRSKEGIAHQERVVELVEEALGPSHPKVGLAIAQLAAQIVEAGNPDEGFAYFDRSLELLRQSAGSDHPVTIRVISNRAATMNALGRHEEALVSFQEVLDATRHGRGLEKKAEGVILVNIGKAQRGLGRFDEALESLERSVEARKQAYGSSHPHVASSLMAIAATLRMMDRHEEALPRAQQATDMMLATVGEDHPYLARSRVELGMCELELGRPKRALDLAEAALKVLLDKGGPERPIAETRFLIAQALIELDLERSRARSLAIEARDVFSAAESRRGADVEAWLERHRLGKTHVVQGE